jgi:5-methyltetrahydrofolate--homocysteine methyltransferase
MSSSPRTAFPLCVKPNAGIPRIVGESIVYEADPETLAHHLQGYVERGAGIVGGCCGSTPEHITALAHALAPVDPS